jgi:ferritin-like metal-binding protein YciE
MGLFTGLELNSMKDLFAAQIADLYDAETRLTQALPKMAAAAASPELRRAIEQHLQETEGHVRRLERVWALLGTEPTRQTCAAMKGLVAEGDEAIGATGDPTVKDAALIAAAQRVEHYEISGYGSARTFARWIGLEEAARLLSQTLEEEAAADEKLTRIAESGVNAQAAQH